VVRKGELRTNGDEVRSTGRITPVQVNVPEGTNAGGAARMRGGMRPRERDLKTSSDGFTFGEFFTFVVGAWV